MNYIELYKCSGLEDSEFFILATRNGWKTFYFLNFGIDRIFIFSLVKKIQSNSLVVYFNYTALHVSSSKQTTIVHCSNTYMVAMDERQSTLILTSGPVLSLDQADTALALCSSQENKVWDQSLDIVLGCGDEDGGWTRGRKGSAEIMTSALHSKDTRRVESTRYDHVVVVLERAGNYNHAVLTKEEIRKLYTGAAMMLRPGGYLYVVAPEYESKEHIKLELTMLGCTNVCIAGTVGKDGARVVVGRGKKFEKKEAQAISRGTLSEGAQTWKLAMDDDDDELIDEDELLDEDEVVVEAAPVDGSCGSTAKKSCSNCTCGRAEGKITKLTKDMIENPQSGCGSCSLGDAFRCAGCPYRGLPAFEMGKKIELPSDFLVDDLE